MHASNGTIYVCKLKKFKLINGWFWKVGLRRQLDRINGETDSHIWRDKFPRLNITKRVTRTYQ